MQGAAFALGAAAIDCRLLSRGDEVGGLRNRSLEVLPAKSQRLTAIAVGEQTEVADLDEATRQHVKQEATDELNRIEAHDLDAVVVSGVAPLKAHLSVVQIQEPAIGDGDTMGVAGQVLEHMRRTAERRLGIDDPFLVAQRGDQAWNGPGFAYAASLPGKRSWLLSYACLRKASILPRNMLLSTDAVRK